jgi:molybdate-binding protein/DNA-binding transcriptional regulator YhcF (GntR family)
MDESHLYQKIAESIRLGVLNGSLKPGDRLPSVRAMAARWDCTIGTVQHAYQELAQNGLVVSRAGQGTRIVEKSPRQDDAPLRKANLVHRAEAFLLEVLTAGYTPNEVEGAVQMALDRWRTVTSEPNPPSSKLLRFAGSHDLAVTWLATHFTEIAPDYNLQLNFNGSLGGLIALAEGKADLAGCHLWDQHSDDYNLPFVRRLLPGREAALITLAHRRLGLILPAGNPANVQSLLDLTRPELRFANRQSGAGTRVWLDSNLRRLDISASQIHGYEYEVMTHSDLARSIAEGRADLGLGLEASARAFGLDFCFQVSERYDLVIPAECFDHPGITALRAWLAGDPARSAIAKLAGYDTHQTGRIQWVEP